MDPTHAAKAKERVEATIMHVEYMLGMDELGITMHHAFNEAPASDDPDESRTVAETKAADWEYRQATIRWYLPAIHGLSDEELRADVLHEYVHVLLAPMESEVPDKFGKQREFAVETITRAILYSWEEPAS